MKKTWKLILLDVTGRKYKTVTDNDSADEVFEMCKRFSELGHIQFEDRFFNPTNIVSMQFKATWKTKFIETFLEKK